MQFAAEQAKQVLRVVARQVKHQTWPTGRNAENLRPPVWCPGSKGASEGLLWSYVCL